MLKIETLSATNGILGILYVRWLDYDPYMKFNFEEQFFGIIDLVKKWDVKKLLLDASDRRHHPSEKDFREIFELFFSGLSETGLEKFARVCPLDPIFACKFEDCLDAIKEDLRVKFELQHFKNFDEARKWLCIE